MYGTDSDFCQRLASELGITVLDCDYAKVCLSIRFILDVQSDWWLGFSRLLNILSHMRTPMH